MEFPLSPLLEWQLLYRSYDPHLDTDATTYWNAPNSVLAEELVLSAEGISTWVSRLSNASTNLVKCVTMTTADSAILGPTINLFLSIPETTPGAMKWQI
eukprot:1808644-Rhodomonas_salina.1